MGNCGNAEQIEESLGFPCVDLVPGVLPTVYIGYVRDVVGLTPKAGDDKTIAGIILKAGKKLVKIEGFKLSNAPSLGFTATDFGNIITHNIQIVVFDRSSKGRKGVDKLVQATDLFAIVREKGLTGKWEVYGIKIGMSCNGLSSALNDANAGAYVLTFGQEAGRTTPEIVEKLSNSGLLDETETYLESIALQIV